MLEPEGSWAQENCKGNISKQERGCMWKIFQCWANSEVAKAFRGVSSAS